MKHTHPVSLEKFNWLSGPVRGWHQLSAAAGVRRCLPFATFLFPSSTPASFFPSFPPSLSLSLFLSLSRSVSLSLSIPPRLLFISLPHFNGKKMTQMADDEFELPAMLTPRASPLNLAEDEGYRHAMQRHQPGDNSIAGGSGVGSAFFDMPAQATSKPSTLISLLDYVTFRQPYVAPVPNIAEGATAAGIDCATSRVAPRVSDQVSTGTASAAPNWASPDILVSSASAKPVIGFFDMRYDHAAVEEEYLRFLHREAKPLLITYLLPAASAIWPLTGLGADKPERFYPSQATIVFGMFTVCAIDLYYFWFRWHVDPAAARRRMYCMWAAAFFASVGVLQQPMLEDKCEIQTTMGLPWLEHPFNFSQPEEHVRKFRLCLQTVPYYGLSHLLMLSFFLNLHTYVAAIVNLHYIVFIALGQIVSTPNMEQKSLWNYIALAMIVVAPAIGGVMIAQQHESVTRRQFKQVVDLSRETAFAKAKKNAADAMLCAMVPTSVLTRMMLGIPVADFEPQAAVMFSDIAGFTAWSATKTAREVVNLVHTMVTRFDTLTHDYGIEKIQTQGDAYWAVCGVPNRGVHSASNMCAFALEIHVIVDEVQRRPPDVDVREAAAPKVALKLRVGVSTGPVSGAIFGTQRFSYQLVGPASELASLAEQHGTIGRVMVTQETIQALGREPSWKAPVLDNASERSFDGLNELEDEEELSDMMDRRPYNFTWEPATGVSEPSLAGAQLLIPHALFGHSGAAQQARSAQAWDSGSHSTLRTATTVVEERGVKLRLNLIQSRLQSITSLVEANGAEDLQERLSQMRVGVGSTLVPTFRDDAVEEEYANFSAAETLPFVQRATLVLLLYIGLAFASIYVEKERMNLQAALLLAASAMLIAIDFVVSVFLGSPHAHTALTYLSGVCCTFGLWSLASSTASNSLTYLFALFADHVYVCVIRPNLLGTGIEMLLFWTVAFCNWKQPLQLQNFSFLMIGVAFGTVLTLIRNIARRKQFVDKKLAEAYKQDAVALERAQEHLLETVVPTHAIAELQRWTAQGMPSRRSIVRELPKVAVAFIAFNVAELANDPQVVARIALINASRSGGGYSASGYSSLAMTSEGEGALSTQKSTGSGGSHALSVGSGGSHALSVGSGVAMSVSSAMSDATSVASAQASSPLQLADAGGASSSSQNNGRRNGELASLLHHTSTDQRETNVNSGYQSSAAEGRAAARALEADMQHWNDGNPLVVDTPGSPRGHHASDRTRLPWWRTTAAAAPSPHQPASGGGAGATGCKSVRFPPDLADDRPGERRRLRSPSAMSLGEMDELHAAANSDAMTEAVNAAREQRIKFGQLTDFRCNFHCAVDEILKRYEASIDKVKIVGDTLLLAGPGAMPATTTDNGGSVEKFASPAVAEAVVALCDACRDLTEDVSACRAGLHFGPCVGAVIGVERLCWDVFGDSVNTASRVLSATTKAVGAAQPFIACTREYADAYAEATQSGAASSRPRAGASSKTVAATTFASWLAVYAKGKGEITVYRATPPS
mgnify:CR=1 FL=1